MPEHGGNNAAVQQQQQQQHQTAKPRGLTPADLLGRPGHHRRGPPRVRAPAAKGRNASQRHAAAGRDEVLKPRATRTDASGDVVMRNSLEEAQIKKKKKKKKKVASSDALQGGEVAVYDFAQPPPPPPPPSGGDGIIGEFGAGLVADDPTPPKAPRPANKAPPPKLIIASPEKAEKTSAVSGEAAKKKPATKKKAREGGTKEGGTKEGGGAGVKKIRRERSRTG
jgi:hypothetical protein